MEEIWKRYPFLNKQGFVGENVQLLPHTFGGSFLPLKILECNGKFGECFSEASVVVTAYPDICGYGRKGISDIHVYMGVIYDLLFNPAVDDIKRTKALKNLGNFFSNKKHSQCLEKMSRDTEKLSESTLQAVLAVHLFEPLLQDAKTKVDGSRYKGKGDAKCKYCDTPVKAGDTSFGNSEVWHGYGDILLDNSVVRIRSESEGEKEATDELLEYKLEEHNASVEHVGESAAKKMKLENLKATSGDVGGSDFESPLNTTVIKVKLSNNDYMPGGPTKIPFIDSDVKQQNRTLSQVLAQTIVNAFIQVKQNPNLKSYFIPTFLASDKYVTIHMYNPDDDVLLTQGKAMPLWTSGTLTLKTILSIWMSLNMLSFSKCIPANCLDGLSDQSGLYDKKSNFYALIGPKLEIYKNKLNMPIQKQIFASEFDYDTDCKESHQFVDKALEILVKKQAQGKVQGFEI